MLPIPEEKIVRKWRLQPGKMLLIDLEQGRIVEDEEVKATLADAEPYGDWLQRDPVQPQGPAAGLQPRSAGRPDATSAAICSRRSAIPTRI